MAWLLAGRGPCGARRSLCCAVPSACWPSTSDCSLRVSRPSSRRLRPPRRRLRPPLRPLSSPPCSLPSVRGACALRSSSRAGRRLSCCPPPASLPPVRPSARASLRLSGRRPRPPRFPLRRSFWPLRLRCSRDSEGLASSVFFSVEDPPDSQPNKRLKKPGEASDASAFLADVEETGAGCAGVIPLTNASGLDLTSCSFGAQLMSVDGASTNSKLVLMSSKRGSS